jgi:hypothetical protein
VNPLVWLLVGGAALAGISYLVKMRHTRTLPTLTDKEFLSLYRVRFTDPDDFVLEQRSIIANYLGLPTERLSPNYSFKRLSSYTGFVGEYEMGMSDLETKLVDLFAPADLDIPGTFPETVGELIHQLARAKKKLATPTET